MILCTLNSALGLVVHCRLSDKLSTYGLFIGYVNLFWRYLTNESCYVCFYGVPPSLLIALSRVPRDSVFGRLFSLSLPRARARAHTHGVMVCGKTGDIFLLFAEDINHFGPVTSIVGLLSL